MDFETFNKAEQSREQKYADAVAKALEKYTEAVAKAADIRDAALARADDDNLTERDSNESAFNGARQKERDDAVRALNLSVGLDAEGNPVAVAETPVKKTKAKKAPKS